MKLGSWFFYCLVGGYLEEAQHTILSFLFLRCLRKELQAELFPVLLHAFEDTRKLHQKENSKKIKQGSKAVSSF